MGGEGSKSFHVRLRKSSSESNSTVYAALCQMLHQRDQWHCDPNHIRTDRESTLDITILNTPHIELTSTHTMYMMAVFFLHTPSSRSRPQPLAMALPPHSSVSLSFFGKRSRHSTPPLVRMQYWTNMTPLDRPTICTCFQYPLFL